MCVSSIDQSRRRSLGSAASELLKPTTDNTKEGTPSPVKTSKINNGAAKDILKPQQKHCVQHNYHDHALDNDATFKAQRSNVSKGGVTVPFPVKLHDMLEHIEMNEPQLTSVVSWQPHGRCFLVHKPKLFADQVLARFFQQKKYASFQRQLNLYGFNRITKGPDRGSYYHELFLRGKKFLCKGINRMKIKGTGARMASNPDAEPDFYKMKPLEAGAVGDENIAKVVSSNTMVDTEPVKSESGAMPPLSNPMAVSSTQEDELDYVFDDMPFHCIDQLKGSRRHSLMEIHRRNSLLRRNSLISIQNGVADSDLDFLQPQPDDDAFFKEMDMISSLGNSSLSDQEMVDILNKIIQ